MRFWEYCNKVLNKAIDTAADTLSAAGSFACVTGGMGLAVSYTLNEEIEASYYGLAETTGAVNIRFNILEYGVKNNQTIPVFYSTEESGDVSYALKDFLNPGMIRFMSVICISSGSALKIIGNQLKHWHQDHKDIQRLQESRGIEVAQPSWDEIQKALLSSVFSSVSQTLWSTAITQLLLDRLFLFISQQDMMSYPAYSTRRMDAKSYNGPVAVRQFALQDSVSKNGSVHLPIFANSIEMRTTLAGMASINITYGGELTIEPGNSEQTIAIASLLMAAGATSHFVASYFEQQRQQLKEDRLLDAPKQQADGYRPLPAV